jgi:CheY-like chemotaxis protein
MILRVRLDLAALLRIVGPPHALWTPPMSDQPPDSTTILVVEDQDEVREMIVRSLVQEGYRVVQARDGVQALALLGSDPRIDLVITDIGMPNMGGLTLARRATLVARPPGAPVHLGLRSNPAEIPGALLAKPFEPDTLVAEVRRLLSTASPPD